MVEWGPVNPSLFFRLILESHFFLDVLMFSLTIVLIAAINASYNYLAYRNSVSSNTLCV